MFRKGELYSRREISSCLGGNPMSYLPSKGGRVLYACLTAGCIDADLHASRRTFGRSDEPLIEATNVHRVTRVTFTETRCETRA